MVYIRLKGLLVHSIAVFLLLCIPLSSRAQFERKISLNLSGGVFKTFGDKAYPDTDDKNPEKNEIAYLMPNFEIGYSLQGGLQYNFSRQLSIELNIGYMHSAFWWYDVYDEYDNPCSYLGFTYTESGEEETESNFLMLNNLHFGLASRYYFLPANKFNPYALVEVNLNILDSEYIDHQWDVYERLGRLDELGYENSTSQMILEAHSCVGFLAGGGVDYSLNENISFFFEAGYWFIFLNWEEYIQPVELSNFNALKFHLGARFSFIKSKQL
jgi:opacity protein-like surface antigen